MQVLCFILVICSYLDRYLCLHQRSSSPPHEWKIRNGQKTAILSKLLAAEKHAFERNMCIWSGSGEAMEGLWVSRSVFLRHTGDKKGAVVVGRKAAAAPREHSPERVLQVQPVGPCASGEREHLSLSNFATSVGFQHRRILIKSSSG